MSIAIRLADVEKMKILIDQGLNDLTFPVSDDIHHADLYAANLLELCLAYIERDVRKKDFYLGLALSSGVMAQSFPDKRSKSYFKDFHEKKVRDYTHLFNHPAAYEFLSPGLVSDFLQKYLVSRVDYSLLQVVLKVCPQAIDADVMAVYTRVEPQVRHYPSNISDYHDAMHSSYQKNLLCDTIVSQKTSKAIKL